MKVHVLQMGNGVELELQSGCTVLKALIEAKIDPSQEMSAFVNGSKAVGDDVLRDGDVLLAAFPIRGAAPLPRGHRPKAASELRAFAFGAVELVVSDPYFFRPWNSTEQDYATYLSFCVGLDSGTLKRLHVLDDWRKAKRGAVTSFEEQCQIKRCSLTRKSTDHIHDRIWTKDRSSALLVGTSVNSLGNKLAFCLEMPKPDFQYILAYLKRKGLLPD